MFVFIIWRNVNLHDVLFESDSGGEWIGAVVAGGGEVLTVVDVIAVVVVVAGVDGGEEVQEEEQGLLIDVEADGLHAQINAEKISKIVCQIHVRFELKLKSFMSNTCYIWF